ncbi:MAG TPA: MFS transporter [Chthoniobacterales bacterium]|nr:MFS transporter [Chthoniobacterales bacterium]
MIGSSALLNRAFLRIWLASLVSGTAVAAHDTAATWMMNLMSPSGLFISLIASLAALPFFLFTLPGGALADAFNERRILRLANLWLAGCAGALALLGWAGRLNPILLLAGVFLLGVGFAINAPAWVSLIPQIVTDEELPSATTLAGVQLNISSILGPALAGVLLAKVAAPVVFGLNAMGFLLVFAAIPSLQKTGSGLSQTLTSFARSISSAFRYVGQTQNVRSILLRNTIFSSFVVVVPALTPVLLLKELRLDGSSLGLVFASMGVGSVASAIFIIPWLRSRFSTEVLMTISQVTLAGIYLVMAMVHHCLYCLVPMALAGASWTLAASELWVIAQRAIPNSARGRISALMMVLSQGAVTIGGVVWGLTAEIAGTRPTLLAASLLFLIMIIGWMLIFRSPPGARNQTKAASVQSLYGSPPRTGTY